MADRKRRARPRPLSGGASASPSHLHRFSTQLHPISTGASAANAAVFAGHTHGGQWRVPVLGAIIIPSAYGRRFDLGHFNVQGRHLYVSADVGADHPPLRIYCPPEIVEVDFRG